MKKKQSFFILLFLSSVLFFSGCKKNPHLYTKCYITSVTVNSLPLTDKNGDNWDSYFQGTYPDVYFKIYSTDDNTLLYSMDKGNKEENVNSFPIMWYFEGFGITFDIEEEFYFAFYDYDSMNDDDLIGYCGWHHLSEYKGETAVDIKSGDISYTLSLKWVE